MSPKNVEVRALAMTVFCGCTWSFKEFPEVIGDFGVRPNKSGVAVNESDAYMTYEGEQGDHSYGGCTGTAIRPFEPHSRMRMVI